MPVFEGSISGSIKSFILNVPQDIVSFYLSNQTVGSITASVGIVISGRDIYIWSGTIAAGASENVPLTKIRMLASCQILVVSSGQLFYYVSTEEVK